MTRLDQIEADMREAKAWGEQGPEFRDGGRTKADDALRKLALLLAEMTEDPETIGRAKTIVELYDAF